jgi:glutathione S-transferase
MDEADRRRWRMTVQLHGFKYSVYSWIVRLALHEKGVAYEWIEMNPFAEPVSAQYLALHPFKRVPTLVHGEFVVYETSAITRYVDEAFNGPRLQRMLSVERARCNQILSIVDSYAYWPLVRQVFSHGVYKPRMRLPIDRSEIRQGLDATEKVLGSLEALASPERFLTGDGPSLADVYLAPMIGYFTLVEEGSVLLQQHDRLAAWWSTFSVRPTFLATTPRLPAPQS